MNHLSNRLLHIAAQVQPVGVLADVGCDHGYLPIYLIQTGRIRRGIAMDIGEGPLQRAREHIACEGLENVIQTRISDGLTQLSPYEADAVVIAGMGGELIMDILSRGEAVARSLSQLILEPQSQLPQVRRFLREQHYFVTDEDLVLEDGKFYPILRILPGEKLPHTETANGPEQSVADAYGLALLQKKHPVLMQYLDRERAICQQILNGLPDESVGGARIAQRKKELLEQLARNEAAADYMKAGEMA